MKTYPTYQEAKIANPECEIVTLIKPDSDLHGLFEPKSVCHIMHPDGGWRICNPADYCMTVEQFLSSGHKFVDGDLIITESGVLSVGRERENMGCSVSECNEPSCVDSDIYILHAAALDKPKQISNTAREVFSGGEKRTKVEFVKVEDSIWHLETDFRCGELYNKSLDCSGEFVVISSETVFLACAAAGNLYRRIETPMTEKEAFIDEFMNMFSHVGDAQLMLAIASDMEDSGKFKLVN